MRENKGITLIALVITIIVLLILAGFSIATIIEDDSIVTKSSNAKLKTEVTLEKETIDLAMISLGTDIYGNTKTVTPEELYDYMSKNSDVRPLSVEEGDELYSLKITFDKDRGNRSYIVSQNGKISEYKEHIQKLTDPNLFIFNEETGMIEGFANLDSESYYYYQTDGWYLDVKPLEYEEKDSNGNVVVKTSTDVIIEVPEEINGVIVTGIADHAFTSHKIYDSIERTLSNRINFYGGFKNIVEIRLPETIEYIGNDAFSDNANLKKINIPTNVKYIGDYAFAWCTSLKNIQLPDGLTTVNEGMFAGCESLSKITIPNTVETIEIAAFEECENLANIELSNSLINIGKSAFYRCYSLTNVKLPNSVTTIGEDAFAGCEKLTTIKLSNSLTELNSGVFYWCESLVDIELPDSLISIEWKAFEYCNSLTNIVIPDSVEIISELAFCDCENLNTIYCESTSKPEGWEDNWNKKSGDIEYSVVWGYTEN